jgi:TorA maturation chaperone TorD
VASNRDEKGSVAGAEVPDEDLLRASTYALLANLLRTQPADATLSELADLETDDSELGEAVQSLGIAATVTTAEAVDDEFHDLFIGVGDSELKPYGSYYLTGFLFEKPLANLRVAMADLGIAAADDSPEPEDHIAALCEMMAGLITGAFGETVDIARQRTFFDDHIAPWAERFFEDLEGSSTAWFYKPVGTIGRLFMRIESQAFQMAA